MMPSDHEPLSVWELVGVLLVVLATAIGGAAVAGALLAVATWVYRVLS